MNIESELSIAKEAALAAGNLLITNKDSLLQMIKSSARDIKLQADISAEKKIIDIISSKSNLPILSEESGASDRNLSNTYWVIDPLDGTANYYRDIPICLSLIHI